MNDWFFFSVTNKYRFFSKATRLGLSSIDSFTISIKHNIIGQFKKK